MLASAFLLLLAAFGCAPKQIPKQQVAGADRVKAVVLAGEGDLLLREGKDHLALIKYVEASVRNPFDEHIFNKLAIAYSRLQQYDEASKAVDRSIGLNPEYAYAHNTRGIVQLAKLDNKGAVRSFRKAIELLPLEEPSDVKRTWEANFYLNLGYAYIQRDKFSRGIEAYRKALELDPAILDSKSVIRLEYSSPATADPAVQFKFSRLFAQLGDKKQALYYLDRALAAGLKGTKKLIKDEAFDALRSDLDFIQLLESYGVQVKS